MGKYTKRFSDEEERAILGQFFTNPQGDISFMITQPGFGPEEQAALAARYSRDPEPFQKKFLGLLERKIPQDVLDRLVADPTAFANPLLGERAKARSQSFHSQWSLGVMNDDWKDDAIRGYGHGSIKDGANVAYHIEGLAEIHTKVITAQPTNRPQVASTRYIEWGDIIAAAEKNVDIAASPHAELILGFTRRVMEQYARFTDTGQDFVADHKMNLAFRKIWTSDESVDQDLLDWKIKQVRRDPERTFTEAELSKQRDKIIAKKEKDWPKYARKTCLDATRSLLLPSIPTFMACATDDTTLERDISHMLSHPLTSVQNLGTKLKEEAQKILPTLMGAYTHAQRDEHEIALREELRAFTAQLPIEQRDAYDQPGRVRFVRTVAPNTDAAYAAAMVYPHAHSSMETLYAHFATNPRDVERVVDIMLEVRGKHDEHGWTRDADELMHADGMKETLINWGADRDMVRHRRLHKTRQLLSTHHGTEMPPMIELLGLKEDFQNIMAEAKATYDTVSTDDPWTAQYVVPFAFKVRRLYTSAFGQDLFVSKLRSGEGGHPSYRSVAWDLADGHKDSLPQFSRLFRVNRETFPVELINLGAARKWWKGLSEKERQQYGC